MTYANRHFLLLGACLWGLFAGAPAGADSNELERLGESLFFDVNMSLERTQSCSTCHDPAHGLADARDNGVAGAASLGDDGRSLGDRNAPTTTYAFLTPSFGINQNGDYAGGLFHDGRSATLVDQAGEPFLNPLEMRMPHAAAVIARVRENPDYEAAFRRQFGASVFNDADHAYRMLGTSLAAFEQSQAFATFDSKYDRHLRGEYQMTGQEELGRKLFFSQLTNCTKCHLLNTHAPNDPQETFTNYRYHNIGIPANAELRRANGLGDAHQDLGLLENPTVADVSQAGKFKVPTLRNVAVTAPYMHNGVFKQLSTAIHFYSQYTVRNAQTLTNPETGDAWRAAETTDTIDLDLLREGQPMDEERVATLEAFLRTLTDRRYEPLLEQAPGD